MATIQVRSVPDDVYEVIARRAKLEGKSLQSYMREQVVAMAQRPSKAEAADALRAARSGMPPVSAEQIVAARELDHP